MSSRWLLLCLAFTLLPIIGCSPAASGPAQPSTSVGAGGSSNVAAQRAAPSDAARQTAPASAAAGANSFTGGQANAPAAAPAAKSGADEATTQLPVLQSLSRMIIYTADLTLLAADLDAFPNQAGTIALSYGGYVGGVETRDENGIPAMVVQIKVPPAGYEATMRDLRGLAVEVRDEKASTKDVTEEHDDVDTQVASLEATHAQLLEIMRGAKNIDEVLKVQGQANQIKLQIDRLKGREVALERLSEFSTITVKALLASVALQKDYTTVRASFRRAEANRANLEAQVQRARTPEDGATLRDRLGEATLEVARFQARLDDLEAKAASARVLLPTSDGALATTRGADTLPKEYIDTRVALRRAEFEQFDLTRKIQAGASDVDPTRLSDAILRVNQLRGQLKGIQDRASQSGVTLPSLSAEEEAALTGLAPIRSGPELPGWLRAVWEGPLSYILGLLSALLFLWWIIPLVALAVVAFRRRSAATV